MTILEKIKDVAAREKLSGDLQNAINKHFGHPWLRKHGELRTATAYLRDLRVIANKK